MAPLKRSVIWKMSDDSTQLWDFTLSLYAKRPIATACLALQDEGDADVCELLWVCWLAKLGLSLSDDAELALRDVRAWQRQFTYPLRAQRRALKSLADQRCDIAQLRRIIKQAELHAERQALLKLQELTYRSYGVTPTAEPLLALKKNLLRLLPKQKKSLHWALQTLETCLDHA